MALVIARTGLVTDVKPKLTAAMSAYDYSEELESLFTFESKFADEGKVCGAVRHGNTLWVPREAVPYAEQDFRTSTVLPAIDCTFVPRHEQGALCERSLGYLKAGRSHIFEAPTGWGKTVAGAYIACKLCQPTMIVVTKDDLVQQWKKAFEILNVPSNVVGHVQADVQDWQGKRFVIGMVQSLIIEGKYPLEMFKYFGFVILDEVHQMAADQFVRACQSFYAKYRLGFSATPDRKDGKTKLLHWNVGPTMVKGNVIQMTPKVIVRQTGWKIPTKSKIVGNEWVQEPIPHGPGRMMLVYKAMVKNDVRNMEVVNFTLQSFKSGRVTLIMADMVEHLERLFQMLTGEGVPGNEIAYYIGGMKKEDLKLAKQRKVVLGTYKMCSTGTDVPVWDTLVMATPRADVKQAIGRVLRWAENKKQPVILDLVDHNAIFQNFHLARLKQYYSLGAKVVKVA